MELLWESNQHLVHETLQPSRPRRSSRAHQRFCLHFPFCFPGSILSTPLPPTERELPGIPACPISGSIFFFFSLRRCPHSVFYHLRYLIWEVGQQRHLHNKLSIISQSRLRTQTRRAAPLGHHEDGKHTPTSTAYLRCPTGLLWLRPESAVRLLSGAARRGGWRWWRSTRSASTSNPYFYTNLRETEGRKRTHKHPFIHQTGHLFASVLYKYVCKNPNASLLQNNKMPPCSCTLAAW